MPLARMLAGATLALVWGACREPPLPHRPLPPLRARPRGPAPIAPSPGFAPGERHLWTVRWRGLPIGHAELSAGRADEPRDGPPGGGQGLEVTSELRLGRLVRGHASLMIRIESRLDGAGRARACRELRPGEPERQRVETTFSGDRYRAVVRAAGSPRTRVIDGRAPEEAGGAVSDLHAALGALRRWASPGRAGRGYLYAFFGGRLYRVDAGEPSEVAGDGTIRLPLRATLQGDDGGEPPLDITLWLSSDDRRVPLRAEIPTARGDVVAELVE